MNLAKAILLRELADCLHDPDFFEASVPEDVEENSEAWRSYERAADELAESFRDQARELSPESGESRERFPECIRTGGSSRTCELGTRACEIRHGKPSEPSK